MCNDWEVYMWTAKDGKHSGRNNSQSCYSALRIWRLRERNVGAPVYSLPWGAAQPCRSSAPAHTVG